LGYLDKILADELTMKSRECLSRGIPVIVFALSGCPIINSFAMAKLIEILDLVAEHNAELWFADLTHLQEQTFEASGLLPLIDRITNLDDAKRELGLS